MVVWPLDWKAGRRILLAGAGGGFDFVCGLPIALDLLKKGHQVFFANYSFTALSQVENGQWHGENLLEVTADSRVPEGDYFPEGLLARWFREVRQEERPVWCFRKVGVQPLLDCYETLVQQLQLDAVLCVDGGVDGLFRGDEHDLGTPSMDAASVIASSLCSAEHRIYVCTAFGIEGAEGQVSHAQALERLADLMRQGAFLGVGSLTPGSSSTQEFLQAVDWMFQRLPSQFHSTIVAGLAASARGAMGRTPVNQKTTQNPPWLSPLTSLFWYCQAPAVAQLKLFYQEVLNSRTVLDIAQAIERTRDRHGVQPHRRIPI